LSQDVLKVPGEIERPYCAKMELTVSSAPIPEPAPLRVLPFHSDAIDWRRFETFCLDLVRALPDVVHAELYNVPGGNQRGIDIVATLSDGRQRTVQCRHRKRFVKSDAEKVVRRRLTTPRPTRSG